MQHETMATRIERAIRRDILAGVLVPGDRLRTAELSTRYGVSHIPVREALRQLEGDRLVVIDPHKGAILRGVTPKYVRNMHDTRAAIETLLVRCTAERITPGGTAELRRYAGDYERAAAAGLPGKMVEANLALHRAIADMADNPVAAHIQEQGWELVVSIRQRYGFGAGRIADIIDQHRQLVDAIGDGDADRAVAVAKLHCDAARDDLLARMAETGETG